MNTALITGASKGLGRALAEALADHGLRVVLVARGEQQLNEAVRAIRARGGEAYGIVADLGAPQAGARIAGEAVARVGPIDVLVHNASKLGPTPLRSLLDTDPAEFQRVLDVNLLGPFRLTRAIAGAMSLRGAGHVVFVSSDAAVEAYPTWGAYGVSKAAADHLAATWRAELPAVRFLVIDPGEMDTDMHAAALPDADRSTLQRPAQAAARVLGLLLGPVEGRVAA